MSNKSKKTGLVVAICIIIILLLAGGFAFYWFNRPIYKVNKAIETGDLVTITEYYSRLSEDDKESVSAQMLEYAEQVFDEFEDSDIEYDELKEIYDELEEEVLDDNDDFYELKEKAKTLYESREAFAEAKDAYKDGDYNTAIKKLAEVDPSDKKNYEDAQELYEECKVLNVVGSWVTSLDFGEYIAQSLGEDIDFEFPINVQLMFNEDGTGYLFLDADLSAELYDSLIDAMVEYGIKEYLSGLGLSEAELNTMAALSGFGDIRSMFRNELKKEISLDYMVDSFKEAIGESNYDFEYEINGSEVEITTDIHGSDTLTITDEGNLELDTSDTEFADFASLLVFEKEE